MPAAQTVIPAIRMKQAGVDIYLCSIPLAVLAQWKDDNRLAVAEWRPQDASAGRVQDAYQRQVSNARANRIKKFAEARYNRASPVLPIFPQSVLLNIRANTGSRIPRVFRGRGDVGTLAVPHAVTFTLWEVDGQHRVEGLIRAYTASPRDFRMFRIPASIINGLTLDQEASEFLIINATQKQVNPGLQLRVISERPGGAAAISQLMSILAWDVWELEALKIAKQLELPASVWHRRISLPGAGRGAGASMTEVGFVSSLQSVCESSSRLAHMDAILKSNLLDEIWRDLAGRYPTCFTNPSDYVLLKTTGVGGVHSLVSLILDVQTALALSLADVLNAMFSPFPDTWWARSGTGAADKGTGRSAWRNVASEIAGHAFALPVDTGAPALMRTHILTAEQDAVIDDAMVQYSQLNLLAFDDSVIRDNVDTTSIGYYGLVTLSALGGQAKVYAGRAPAGLQRRLLDHTRDADVYHLFFFQAVDQLDEGAYGEYALYHLTKRAYSLNTAHPLPVQPPERRPVRCPYC